MGSYRIPHSSPLTWVRNVIKSSSGGEAHIIAPVGSRNKCRSTRQVAFHTEYPCSMFYSWCHPTVNLIRFRRGIPLSTRIPLCLLASLRESEVNFGAGERNVGSGGERGLNQQERSKTISRVNLSAAQCQTSYSAEVFAVLIAYQTRKSFSHSQWTAFSDNQAGLAQTITRCVRE